MVPVSVVGLGRLAVCLRPPLKVVENQGDQGREFSRVKIMSGWPETSSSLRPATRFVSCKLFSSRCLKDESQAELEIPHLRAGSQVEYLAGFGRVTLNTIPGLTQIDVIEYVVALCAELENRAFGNPEFLEHSKITLPEYWPTQCIGTKVSKLPVCCLGPWRSRSYPGNVPLIAALIIGINVVACLIRPARS